MSIIFGIIMDVVQYVEWCLLTTSFGIPSEPPGIPIPPNACRMARMARMAHCGPWSPGRWAELERPRPFCDLAPGSSGRRRRRCWKTAGEFQEDWPQELGHLGWKKLCLFVRKTAKAKEMNDRCQYYWTIQNKSKNDGIRNTTNCIKMSNNHIDNQHFVT